MSTVLRSILLLILVHTITPAQSFRPFDWLQVFPESSYISPFAAETHAHRLRAENIALTKNVRASMGGIIPVFGVSLFGTEMQASLGASVHFELRPNGQAHVVSNDYYVDYLLLDIRLAQDWYTRFVTGHTSHHLSDNTYERLQLTQAFTYSRDYVKLFAVYERGKNEQFYLGADYAYIMTIGYRLSKPWILQTGGKVPLGSVFGFLSLFGAADVVLRQDAGFAATNTLQFGCTLPMQQGRLLRFALQYRKGLDERGQFLPQHRELSTIGFSFE
ncbi:MAG: DUF1207 domain-containing protein [Bacteroidetes bacterium]|nr:DUF1207 domain-containing protein [Bacteroidota bacterium]